jgi:hypothetical protein
MYERSLVTDFFDEMIWFMPAQIYFIGKPEAREYKEQ